MAPVSSALAEAPAILQQTVTGDHNLVIGGVTGPVTVKLVVTDEAMLAKVMKSVLERPLASPSARAAADADVAGIADKVELAGPAVAAFFHAMGETGIPNGGLVERFAEYTTRYKQVQGGLVNLSPTDPAAIRLVALARDALETGRLEEAGALLERSADVEAANARQAGEIRQRAQEAESMHLLNTAQQLADLGKVAMTQTHYRKAADIFARAIGILPLGNSASRIDLRMQQAFALYSLGYELGDTPALRESIVAYEGLVDDMRQDQVPTLWAAAQDNLGWARARLAERLHDAEPARQAIAALTSALHALDAGRTPTEWAWANLHLGTAYLMIAEWGDGAEVPVALEQGRIALRRAIEIWSADTAPAQWAIAQTRLATALVMQAALNDTDTALLEQAVRHYSEALKIQSSERNRHEWAVTQNQLGNALFAWGNREDGTAHLASAAASYRAVTSLGQGEPVQWANAEKNLASTLALIGAREIERGETKSGLGHLDEAIAAFDAAKDIFIKAKADAQVVDIVAKRSFAEDDRTKARTAPDR